MPADNAILSVIICTMNRPRLLRQTLARLSACRRPVNHELEILLIDNACNRRTRELTEDFRDLPLRYIEEPRLGKFNALNHAVNRARGDCLVFLDDDILPHYDLFCVYEEAFDRHPEIHLFGGRIELALPESHDADLVNLPHARLVLAQSNFGSIERLLNYPEMPAGPNMAARRSGLGAEMFFEPIGQDGLSVELEDTTFFKRNMNKGQPVLYLPQARVGHVVRDEQLTLNYFQKRYADCVFAQKVMDDDDQHSMRLLNVPCHLLRTLALNALTYPIGYTGSRSAKLTACVNISATWQLISRYLQTK